MLTFQKYYFLLTVLLLVIEVLIALLLNDGIIRPYGGDFLVVILLYCLLQSFVKISVPVTALVILLLAYAIELLQYFKIVKILGLQHSTLANVLIGNTFAWADLLAYTLGIGVVWLLEKLNRRRQQRSQAAQP